MRPYYWANIILNPIILFGVIILQLAKVEVPDEMIPYLMIPTVFWIILSSLIHPTLRGYVSKFFEAVFGSGIALGFAGGIEAIVMVILVVGVLVLAGIAGMVIALVYLWFASLAALRNQPAY